MKDEDYKSFGAYLKDLRIKKELTVEEFAEKLNLTIEKVKRWEKNLEVPELDDMYKLSEFYEIPCEHLLRLKEELFKPNEKLIRIICKVLGVSITTARIIFYVLLVLCLILAWVFFVYAGQETIKKVSEEREQQGRKEVVNYFKSENH